MRGTVNRQAALNAICDNCNTVRASCSAYPCTRYVALEKLPLEEPTLYGYNIGHLKVIASVLHKEGLSPDRVTEALTDMGRIEAIIRAEFTEELRKLSERCFITPDKGEPE